MTTLALFLLIACGGSETPAADGADDKTEAPAPAGEGDAKSGGDFAAPESLDAGMDICMGNVDCEAVQLSCCCGDDAVWVAAAKSRSADVKAKYAQKDCGDCGDAECSPPEAECKGGCKLVGG